MIKVAIFDVGGVIYPYSLEPLNSALRELTTAKDDFDDHNGVFSFDYNPFMRGEINFSQFTLNLCTYCGVQYTKNIENLINLKMHEGIGEVFKETLECMNVLRLKGVKICLLSNALPNLCDALVGLKVDEMFLSFEMGMIKPQIEIYQQVLEKLRVLPQEVLFVDDKQRNVDAAQTLGIRGVVFNPDTIRDVLLYAN